MRLIKAQSAVEYAIGVAAIILALVAMQAYVKRGLQGRYKDVVDSATKKVTERQFEPDYEDTSVLAKANITRKKKIFPYDVRRDTFSEEYNYTVKRSEAASAGGGGSGSGEVDPLLGSLTGGLSGIMSEALVNVSDNHGSLSLGAKHTLEEVKPQFESSYKHFYEVYPGTVEFSRQIYALSNALQDLKSKGMLIENE
jgi:hypothetical protein